MVKVKDKGKDKGMEKVKDKGMDKGIRWTHLPMEKLHTGSGEDVRYTHARILTSGGDVHDAQVAGVGAASIRGSVYLKYNVIAKQCTVDTYQGRFVYLQHYVLQYQLASKPISIRVSSSLVTHALLLTSLPFHTTHPAGTGECCCNWVRSKLGTFPWGCLMTP